MTAVNFLTANKSLRRHTLTNEIAQNIKTNKSRLEPGVSWVKWFYLVNDRFIEMYVFSPSHLNNWTCLLARAQITASSSQMRSTKTHFHFEWPAVHCLLQFLQNDKLLVMIGGQLAIKTILCIHQMHAIHSIEWNFIAKFWLIFTSDQRSIIMWLMSISVAEFNGTFNDFSTSIDHHQKNGFGIWTFPYARWTATMNERNSLLFVRTDQFFHFRWTNLSHLHKYNRKRSSSRSHSNCTTQWHSAGTRLCIWKCAMCATDHMIFLEKKNSLSVFVAKRF